MHTFRYLGARLIAPLVVLAIAGCGPRAGSDQETSAKKLEEAKQAIAAGNTVGALPLLQASIEAQPTIWAYLERAKLHAKEGRDQEASADCEAILLIHPDNQDVKWIKAELKKPADKRFQGSSAAPVRRK